jgi:hypothetical protein
MQNLKKYLTDGIKNTVLYKNNTGTSHNGPWKQVYTDTLLDRWHVGDFSSVEYTISADFDVNNKELIKVLITATRDTANLVVYARSNTVNDIINITATVNDSYVDVVVNPVIDAEVLTNFTGAKVIYTAQYFHTQNPLVV